MAARGQPSRLWRLTSLFLSAIVVGLLLAPLLGLAPWMPTLGLMRNQFSSSVGREHMLPAPPVRCRDIERVSFGGSSFTAACAGQAPSFDRRFYVVKNAGMLTGVGLVRSRDGASLDDLGPLDGVPFTVFWSPSSYRFFANRKRDSGLDQLHVFEVRGERIFANPALAEDAAGVLRTRRPCMTPEDIGVSGVRWGRDGRRIAMLVWSRRQACGGTGGWRPLWMIGDVVSGRIDPESVRTRGRLDPLPADGPYATL